MKKINSIMYGARIIAAGLLFLLVIPLTAYLLFTVFGIGFMIPVIKISMGIGIVILLFFSVLLAIELHQDRRINRQYDSIRLRKLQIGDRVYECQNCGSRKVKAEDDRCRECGTRFTN